MAKRRMWAEEEYNKLQKLEKLGSGTYGVVYLCQDEDKRRLAVKKIPSDYDNNGPSASWLREVGALKRLRNPHIIASKRAMLGKKSFSFISMDYHKQTLRDWIASSSYSKKLSHKFAQEICIGLHAAHSYGIIHRDLKPHNIVLSWDEEPRAVIIDWGHSRMTVPPNGRYTRLVQTLWYRSPELLLGSDVYDLKIDIWSLGCIIYEMWTTNPMFCGDSEIDQLFRIFKKMGTPNKENWPGIENYPGFKDFIPKYNTSSSFHCSLSKEENELLGKILVLYPPERPSITEIGTLLDLELEELNPEKKMTENSAKVVLSKDIYKAESSCGRSGEVKKDGFKQIRLEHRQILIDWLCDVVESEKLKVQTLTLAVSLMDRYLNEKINQFGTPKLQCIGSAALCIATMIQDIYPTEPRDMVRLADRSFSEEDLLEFINDILTTLDYDIYYWTLGDFAETAFKTLTKSHRVLVYLCMLFPESYLEPHFIFMESLTAILEKKPSTNPIFIQMMSKINKIKEDDKGKLSFFNEKCKDLIK